LFKTEKKEFCGKLEEGILGKFDGEILLTKLFIKGLELEGKFDEG
jgi:hypothetical protein